MDTRLVFTKGYKFRQLGAIIFTGFILLIFFIFLLFQFSFNALILFICDLIITILLNLGIARIYEITIEGDVITVGNVWRSVQYPREQLVDIRLLRFKVPYPFNPYLKFVFKDQKAYVAIIPNSIRYYLSSGGIVRYIGDIKSKVFH